MILTGLVVSFFDLNLFGIYVQSAAYQSFLELIDATEKILPGIRREHKLQLRNSHPAEELTNITTCFEGCLDYILYQPEHFELINVYSPPSKATVASIIGVEDEKKVSLPNFHTPSDHLPLISDFRFSNKNCS